MPDNSIYESVSRYYNQCVETYGTTPRGVDWSSKESQETRFAQIAAIVAGEKPFSIIDYGCGYGALLEFLEQKGLDFQYTGFDWSEKMIEQANKLFDSRRNVRFMQGDALGAMADYTVASGLFNVKQEVSCSTWQSYVIETLHKLDSTCSCGFSFNMLTIYSDREKMRDDLFYADPCFFFDYCKRTFSRNVALLHDYDLYEFTVLVRKTHRA